jgi:protein disulfide-isomerase A1
MKTILFLLTILIYTTNASVVQLTESNFNEALQDAEYLLVKFYAPWCGHCKKLAPEYEKLSDAMEEMVVAKVDATEDKQLAAKYGVTGYPTLKFFVNGTEEAYDGGRTFKTMEPWARMAMEPWAKTIETKDELDAFINNIKVGSAAVVSSRDEKSLKAFKRQYKGIPVGHVVSKGVLEGTDFKIYNRWTDDKPVGRNIHGDEETFIKRNALPPYIRFSSQLLTRAFDYTKSHVLLFLESEDDFEPYKKIFSKLSDIYRPRLAFVLVIDNKRISDSIGVNEYPKVFILNVEKGIVKYPLDMDITEATLHKHISTYFDGKLTSYLKSEKVPDTQDGKTVKIVSKTFESTLTSNSDVFVKFYAPWCGHCKALAPVWDNLADAFKDNHVVIGKYDATANEHPDVHVKSYPTLVYYRNGEAIDYDGDRDLEALTAFVKETVSKPLSHSEL